MRRRFFKVAFFSLISLLAVVIAVGALIFWRVQQGPVSLTFMKPRIEAEMNKKLGGMSVKLSDVILERDKKSGVPSLRLRNIELRDPAGDLIARAPRAAITIDEHELLAGNVIPRSLELIGPRVLVKRNIEGGLELGFGEASPDDNSPIIIDDAAPESGKSGKSDQMGGAPPPIQPATSGAALLDILAGDTEGLLGGIQSIRVSGADISLFDESNDALWNAPGAELAFKKMPYGFAIVANAAIASGGEPWRTEIAANYRRETRTFQVNARISDLVPANVSDEIFALAQLAQFKVPLSGEAEFVLTDKGVITKASAELTASAGRVGFPDFIADPILIDEGQVHLDYEPKTGSLLITNASLLVGGSKAEITGRIEPARKAGGKLSALRIVMNARNVSLDTEGTVKNALAIDRIDFDGIASVEEARLDVTDLVVTSGEAGLRIRGTFLGGEESMAIQIAGRIKDMPSGVLKKLWPPIMAPKTRAWVNTNVKTGRIDDAEFVINFPANALARAQRSNVLPAKAIDVKFSFSNVTTSYFKDLPQIAGVAGEGRVHGNEFDLSWHDGLVTLDSGKKLAVEKGVMTVTELLQPVSPATFAITARGKTTAALEYVDQPALGMLSKSGLGDANLEGDAAIEIALGLPLQKDIPRDKVSFNAKAIIDNASLKGAIDGIDLSGGKITLEVGKTEMSASGPMKINGIPAKITWTRKAGKEASNTATIELELDEAEREKIGAKVNDFLRGPVKVKVTLPEFQSSVRKAFIEADLSKATLRLDAINFARPPVKSSASFTYERGKDKPAMISDLVLTGGGVTIKGDIVIGAKGGIAEARLPVVVLNDENRFGIVMKRSEGGVSVAISGKSFDARPLIKSVFANSSGGNNGAEGPTYFVDANIDRIYAHRGEEITNVTASMVLKGSAVRQTNISGTFLSGQPITMRLTGNGDGSRQLQVIGRDAGSALRAVNLYSKVAGGAIEFTATLSGAANGGLRDGLLIIRNFEVRNEAALAQLDKKGKPTKSGPRRDGLAFKKLFLPFTSDAKFIRINDVAIKGPDICAYAEGIIRKSDTAIDITGTVIPACAANRLLEDIPLVGLFFPEGLLGITYALSGTMKNPKFQANPISALAPGILRKFFSYQSYKPKKRTSDSRN